MSDAAAPSHYMTHDESVFVMSDTATPSPAANTDSDTFGIHQTSYFPYCVSPYCHICPGRNLFLGMGGSFSLTRPIVEAGNELRGAERQLGSGIPHAGPPQPGPFNVSLDENRLSGWPGPDRPPRSPILNFSGDRVPSGRLPTPGSRLVEYTPKLPPTLPFGLVEIPQDRYTNGKGAGTVLQLEDITFSVNNTLGFNMNDAHFKRFAGLDDRDDPVLENANGPVSCRLLFPGYPTRKFSQIAVKDWKKVRSPITRSKLAYEIAKRVKLLLDASATHPIAPSTHPRWTIGQGCMKLEKMYLVRFKWVAKGSLQPEIWVDYS